MARLPLSLALLLPLLTILLASKTKSYKNNLGSGVDNLDISETEHVLASPSNRLHTPHYASWMTWFHPRRTGSTGRRGERDILYHLGGNGPWVELGEGEGIEPPEGCTVDQVHMMSRHAERYPTSSVGSRHLALLDRIKKADIALNGSLVFLNNWTYFTTDPSGEFEQLTTTGPYAGTLGAFTTGVRFRTRYRHLFPRDSHSKIRLWASDSERVIHTAQHFASGVFGLNWEQEHAELQVIPEAFERGADTLTPGDTCLRYLEDTRHGHDNGVKMLVRFQEAYIPAIAERLVSSEGNRALGHLSNFDVFGMQEMCAFETTVRGFSPWCDVFTGEEWEQFEYARDVIHYYRAGPGNPYAGAMGWLWLNATAALLHSGPEEGTLFFSFVHDGDIAPVLTALDIFNDSKYDPNLPVTHVAPDRTWRMSRVMPMGGRITLERMTCASNADEDGGNQTFLRVNINDAIVQLPYCHSGPGRSCPLNEFLDFVRRRRGEVGEFADVCGLDGDVGYISFLKHQ